MNKLKKTTPDECLQIFLKQQCLIPEDFSEGSLLACIDILSNQRFIPILSFVTYDGIQLYMMDPDEIARYKNPELRKKQQAEMEALVNNKPPTRD